ncbi:hypothetical protein [Aminipila terrae]|uniref:Uncharacterized protein n=1 Tax=Aminipila terrae TaxID=2697030 RepID=A0A6P1MBY0_9FIRM|nr:hypothetical protein [Aminipila terrae]QHI72209.1 hypothetical protein Ami3637_07170 [Aminipila terrae]
MSSEIYFEAKKETMAEVESEGGDTLTISQKENIKQKLEELKKIHEQTDYSGMADVEKYRLISKRYDKGFPCMDGKLKTNYDTYKPVAEQAIAEWEDAIPGYLTSRKYSGANYSEFLKKVRRYEGLSNTELIKKTEERYSKNGALTEKVQIMKELWGLGAIDGETYGIFTGSLGYLEAKEYRKAFNVFNIDTQSDNFKNWIKTGGMENLKVDWEELKNNLFQNIDVKIYGDKKQKN